ncbi:MAG: SLC13 family permease [Steroidobacteraceae bacterium]
MSAFHGPERAMLRMIPSPHAVAALLLTIMTFVMFATARVRIEFICLGLIAVLALGFYLFPFEQAGSLTGMEVAFGGFGHEALVAISCLMILGRGLVVTGALEPAAAALTRLWRFSRLLGLLCTLLIAAILSMFVNDTPVLVLVLPILLTLGTRIGAAASKTLMPVNCAILIGGMATTIGTSTNILVVSIARDMGLPPLGVFQFAPIVAIAAAVALPYLWFIMPRLLPDTGETESRAPRDFESTLHITASSSGHGKPAADFLRRIGSNVRVHAVLRGNQTLADGDGQALLEAGDRILVTGTAEALRELQSSEKILLAESHVLQAVASGHSNADIRIAQVVVGSESTLLGRTVRSARIADRYQVAVLGTMHAADRLPALRRSPDRSPIDVGDVLLVQGTSEHLADLEIGEGVMALEGGIELPRTSKALTALLIMAAVVIIAATKTLPIAIAALAGTIAMLAAGCVKFEGLGRALSLEVIVLVAASIALGRALVETGAANWLGITAAIALQSLPPAAIIAALMLLVTVLTNFVSNAAAAAVGTPLAVSLASQLHLNAEPFVIAVLFGCNLCYVTPVAYQTNMLIMSAARYQFRDFVRAGLPLALLMISVLAYLLVRHYGL